MDVIVSNPNVVQAVVHTSRRTMLIGSNPGQTNVYFYSHDGRELLNVDIRVERDIGGLESLIKKNAPDSNVEVQVFNSNILLTGAVPNAASADKVEKLARMWLGAGGGGEGLDLSAIGDLGGSTVSLLNQVGPSLTGGFQASGTYNNTGGGDLSSLSGALTALEQVGLVRTLAEPTLTAISGETANFLAGGEIPIFSGLNQRQKMPLSLKAVKMFWVFVCVAPILSLKCRLVGVSSLLD